MKIYLKLIISVIAVGFIFLMGNSFLVAVTTNETIQITEAHNYPNPFDNEKEVTHIKFKIQSDVTNTSANISVIIYNFNGKKVWSKRVLQGEITPNEVFDVIWGGENDMGDKVSNGLYFCKIIVEANNTVYKIIKILVK